MASAPVANVPWRFGKKVENPPLEPYVSYEQYMKLTNDMSYEQVCDLFGRPGKEEHFFRSGDSSTGTYRWKNADGSYVYIIFNGYKDTNHLSAKTNHNLR